MDPFASYAAQLETSALFLGLREGGRIENLNFYAGEIGGYQDAVLPTLGMGEETSDDYLPGTILLGVVTAVVPYATIPWERRIARRGLLEGAWRTEAGDDPRDASALDRAFRWGVGHPILLAVVALVLVAIAFAALLAAGPPSEWGA